MDKLISSAIFIDKYLRALPADFQWQKRSLQIYPLSFFTDYFRLPIPLIRTNYNFLFYLREGSFLQKIDNEEYHVKKNSVVFVSAGTASSLKKVSKQMNGYFILIEEELMPVLFGKQQLLNLFTINPVYCLSPLGISNFSGATMRNATTRLIGLEHPLAMITAIVLITIGYSKSKRATDARVKFKHIAIFYSIALALILLRIPWSYWMSL